MSLELRDESKGIRTMEMNFGSDFEIIAMIRR